MTTEREFLGGVGTELDSPIGDSDTFVCELVRLIAEATAREPLELPPLADTVDPEAVHRVLESGEANGAKVNLPYAGCEIVVTSDGELFVLDDP